MSSDAIFRNPIEAEEQLELERRILKSDELRNEVRVIQARVDYLEARRKFWEDEWKLTISKTEAEFETKKNLIKCSHKIKFELARLDALEVRINSLDGYIRKVADRLALRRR